MHTILVSNYGLVLYILTKGILKCKTVSTKISYNLEYTDFIVNVYKVKCNKALWINK